MHNVSDNFLNIICYLLYAFAILLTVGFFAVKTYFFIREFKRKKGIKDYCKANKINFSNSLSSPYFISKTPTLPRGEKPSYENIMTGYKDNYKYSLLDEKKFYYDNGVKYFDINTLCVLSKEKLVIPEFTIEEIRHSNRKSFLSELIGSYGDKIKGIDFSEDKSFSNDFIVQGKTEEEIKKFFDEKVRNSLKRNYKGYNFYKSENNCFIIYVRKAYDINERLALLEKSLKLFDAFFYNN